MFCAFKDARERGIQEAVAIAHAIADLIAANEAASSEIAVLCRLHSLSRTIQNVFEQHSISCSLDEQSRDESVSILTVHQAKGLQWRVVFIPGADEGVFPHLFSLDNVETLEEERRLMYVAVTRAIDRLYLSSCKIRQLNNKIRSFEPSRFISEMLDTATATKANKELEAT